MHPRQVKESWIAFPFDEGFIQACMRFSVHDAKYVKICVDLRTYERKSCFQKLSGKDSVYFRVSCIQTTLTHLWDLTRKQSYPCACKTAFSSLCAVSDNPYTRGSTRKARNSSRVRLTQHWARSGLTTSLQKANFTLHRYVLQWLFKFCKNELKYLVLKKKMENFSVFYFYNSFGATCPSKVFCQLNGKK